MGEEEEVYQRMVQAVEQNFVQRKERKSYDNNASAPQAAKFQGLRKGFLNAPPPRKKQRMKAQERPEMAVVAPDTSSCKQCQKKIPLTMQLQSRCRCGHSFCCQHLHEHKCTFDHREVAKQRLQKENPKIQSQHSQQLL